MEKAYICQLSQEEIAQQRHQKLPSPYQNRPVEENLKLFEEMKQGKKLIQLLEKKIVNGWDDPRLFTLNALKRRGFSPDIINQFLDQIKVSRTGNENIIQVSLLESVARNVLYQKTPKTMAIIEPFEIIIDNYGEFFENQVKQKTLFVDKSDVRLTKPNNTSVPFYGIFPDSILAFKYLGVLQVVQVDEERARCKIISIEEKYRRKQKAQIHWIDPEKSTKCEIRIFNKLFNVENPS
ncbi:hypothetical protein IMG5_096490, partial [Ichthyophthirius multifiliis]